MKFTAADPETDDVRAVLVHEVLGHGRLGILALLGLGDLPARVHVHDEPVREALLVRRVPSGRHRHDERRLEPAAVLVGGFEVQVGGAVHTEHFVDHRLETHPGVDPHVERVVAARRARGQVEGLRDDPVVRVEPDVAEKCWTLLGLTCWMSWCLMWSMCCQ